MRRYYNAQIRNSNNKFKRITSKKKTLFRRCLGEKNV